MEHTWEVETQIKELSEVEKRKGATYGGALQPGATLTSSDGKQMTHQFIFTVRGGGATSLKLALHELIHLRISVDRILPPAERSTFFNEYNKFYEMSEVTAGAKFGKPETLGEKSSYGALAIASGNWGWVKNVLDKIQALRNFLLVHDPGAKATFDSDPEVAPATLIEFLIQEKYATQTAARIAVHGEPDNDTVAKRYAKAVAARFGSLISESAKMYISKGRVSKEEEGAGEGEEKVVEKKKEVGKKKEADKKGEEADKKGEEAGEQEQGIGEKEFADHVGGLTLATKLLYNNLDKSLHEAKEFQNNPPKPPADMLNTNAFEVRPVGLDDQPIPFK